MRKREVTFLPEDKQVATFGYGCVAGASQGCVLHPHENAEHIEEWPLDAALIREPSWEM